MAQAATTHNGRPPRKPRTEKFGPVLKELRESANMTQLEVARRSGLSAGYIGLIETGKRGDHPTLDAVMRICQAVRADRADTERVLRATGHLLPGQGMIPEGRPSFAEFVDSDVLLTRTQKQLLKKMYESWSLGRSR